MSNDIQTRLAFFLAENPGGTALLLGSGLSRSAQIPTGWEITLDLIRRAAELRGIPDQPDWENWYAKEEGRAPSYSSLLAELGATAAERRAIIARYIEADEVDRLEGRKLPTAAHKSIAKLVRHGAVRVVVTTNFDRLLENALRDEGIEPTVVASVDALIGAEPLAHASCYVLKLHGDYKDDRILNTTEELSEYAPELGPVLDRIFDEYGLLIVGWSGEWDRALRSALERTPSRRYPTFWCSIQEPIGRAAELIAHRKASVIQISDADSFFASLDRDVTTLIASRRRNPDSVELLVGSAKRFLSSSSYRIELEGLVGSEVAKILALGSSEDLPNYGQSSEPEFRRRIDLYQSATEGLAKVFGAMGRWGDGEEFPLVIDTLRAAHSEAQREGAGLTMFLGLRSYPAVLLMSAYGLGLTKSERWDRLHQLFNATLPQADRDSKRVVDTLCTWDWKGGSDDYWRQLKERNQEKTPLSNHLFELFSNWTRSFVGVNAGFEILFAKYELLLAAAHLEKNEESMVERELSVPDGKTRMSTGRFGWDSTSRRSALEELSSAETRLKLLQGGFLRQSNRYFDLFLENVSRISKWMQWR